MTGNGKKLEEKSGMIRKMQSVQNISPNKKASNKKSSDFPVVIPSARYKKRQGTDEESTKSFTSSALKRLISNRSFSHPAHRRGSGDGLQDARSHIKSQLSLFQSPFDYGTGDDQETYRYDVNISYHKNQQAWVEEFLVPIIETELGLRCYLSDRDSLPGVSTVKNIAAAVNESRITVLCFSKDYLASSWQNYEALLAHHMDPVGWKKRILPIMVESCALPPKYTIYASLKWPENTNAEAVPASVRLRRRFFIFGLLNALGFHDKEKALEIYKACTHFSSSVHPLLIVAGSNEIAGYGHRLYLFLDCNLPTTKSEDLQKIPI